ncbi:MAG: AAA family ATPase [Lachnospiraceae bacterium]|nr:AAA family ATPase [Lachnospiraceae bacterium]
MKDVEIEKLLSGTGNLFITGPAGTGKSYILNKYINEQSNVLVCAPTGIAALHIGGETMHKQFHIPIPAFEAPSFAKGRKDTITKGQLQVIACADTIIIDEISMCRNDVFRFAVKVIRKAEKLKGSKIRIIVSGDFSQLPPVVKASEASLMKKFGLDASGYAFTTQEWKSLNFEVVELTDVKRQENADFISILNDIRLGKDIHLDYFERFVNEDPDYEDNIVICGTNARADKINREYLDSLPGQAVVFQAYKEGRANYTSGFNNDLIVAKAGAKVIFISNDTIEGKYKNGTFGVIKSFNEGSVMVDIDGNDVEIRRQEYPVYSYSVSGSSLQKKEVGMIRQFPFKIGKAITIHKSQGQTFDRAIISPEIFAAGQLYVVLSRVRSPEGLTLLKPIEPKQLIIDPVVEKFYRNGYIWDAPVKKTAVVKKAPVKKTAAKKSTGKTKTTRRAAQKPVKRRTSK